MPAWFEVTVDVPTELSEAVASLLLDLGSPGLEYSDEDGVTSLVAYFREIPALEEVRQLCSQASEIAGLPCSPVIRSRSIDDQNWAEDWKRHFRPTAIGERFLVTPPWDSAPPTDRIVIVIEPGMAFGTGQHPTTRGCLRMIENAAASHEVARALDVGTGSGILSIALAKLGVGCVYAADNDPLAAEAAAANSAKNDTADAVHVLLDWRSAPGRFDLIVANLFANLLCDLASDLQAVLAPNGVLVCSGFLTSDETAVVAAYPGLVAVRRFEEDGWVSLSLGRLDASR